jgi:outer membrane protein
LGYSAATVHLPKFINSIQYHQSSIRQKDGSMKRILTRSFVLLSLTLLITGATAQSQFKFGVIDTQKVVENFKKALDANEVLTAAGEKLKGELEKMRDEIRTMEERLTKQRLFLEDVQTEALESEILQRRRDYENRLKAGQESILAKEKELFEPILKEIEELIKQVGKDEGYSLILDKRLGALYVDTKYDLTQNIIDQLNKDTKKPKAESDSTKQPATPK